MLNNTNSWHSNLNNGMPMLQRKTTTEMLCMPVLNNPTTPDQTVSWEDWPNRLSCMMGRKFAGTYNSNAARTRARLRLTTL
ncbi:hypothetical protein D9M73_288100 [compost metagenome]